MLVAPLHRPAARTTPAAVRRRAAAPLALVAALALAAALAADVANAGTLAAALAHAVAPAAALATTAAPPAIAPHPAPAPAAPAVPSASPYAVRLARPHAVGQRQLVVGSLSTDDRSSGGGKGAVQNEHDSGVVRFVVVTEALAVSPRGNVQRARITVRRLFKESGGVEVELAKPGDELRAYVEGHRHVVELRGAEAASDIMQALGAAADLRADDEPTEDDLFGSAERRAAGASWPVHAAVFARAGAQQLSFDPANVAGTVTLAGVRSVKGVPVPCLEVRWQLEAHGGSFKSGTLPPGLLGTMSVLSVHGAAVVPADPALPPVERDSEIAGIGDFTGTTDKGDPLTLHRQLRQTLHLEISKVP